MTHYINCVIEASGQVSPQTYMHSLLELFIDPLTSAELHQTSYSVAIHQSQDSVCTDLL